ncbi:MAG: glycosyltransferase, partial [Coriobacteriia bacterium]|nr:glycosyltransferase [Coriobacteriia bacterium]
MMKVLLDYRMVTWSGIGRYSQELARALHERDDIELCLIKTKDNQLPIELTDVSYFDAGAHPLSSKGFRELRMATRSFVPDLLHCTHISTPNLKGLVSSEGKKIPVVTTLHDLTPIIVDGVMPSFAKRAIYSGLNQRAVNWSSALITPSQHTIGDLEKYFPKIACPITAIPLAADELLKVEPVKPSAMNYLSPVFQRNFLLSFGNTKPHKDLPTLFAAFEQVAAGHDDISLLLVGKEPPNYLRQ